MEEGARSETGVTRLSLDLASRVSKRTRIDRRGVLVSVEIRLKVSLAKASEAALIARLVRKTSPPTLYGFGQFGAFVLAWQVRHDLPRPPSVIDDKLGDKTFTTYAGPDEEEPQEIKASEWEPFIRTMPHSEFPSGSACICQVWIFCYP